MATIVNARDVLLQAVPANQRVAIVTMADNIQVSQANVTGLGLVLEGTKQAWLAGTSQIFHISKTGAVSPSSITIAANLRNLSASAVVTLAVVSGSVSGSVSLSVDNHFTLDNASLQTDIVTFRLSAVDGGKTYSDDFTIVKVREGADSLAGYLTNEAHTLASDSLGNVTSYYGANGIFKVFLGSNDITNLCSFSVVVGGNPDNLVNNLGAFINASTGVYAVTNGYPTNKEVCTVTMRATFGTAFVDKVFTVSKAKSGIDAVDYDTIIESDKGTVFRVGGSVQMTLRARVFLNGTEVTDSLPDQRFSWRRQSYFPRAYPNDDATWNQQFSSGYKQITITVDSVEHHAQFICDITDQ